MQYIIGIIVISIMFLVGSASQAYKKGIKLGTGATLNLIDIIIIKIKGGIPLKKANNFSDYYGDIKVIKKSKTNLKQQTSINIMATIILIICLLLIIINLEAVSGNIITKMLFDMLSWVPMIGSIENMNTAFTAVVFSALSFSLGQIYNTWKSTKELRAQKRLSKMKQKVFESYTSGEIYKELVNKDVESLKKYKEN